MGFNSGFKGLTAYLTNPTQQSPSSKPESCSSWSRNSPNIIFTIQTLITSSQHRDQAFDKITAHFRFITQRVVVMSHRPFGQHIGPMFRVQESRLSNPEDGTDSLFRNVCKKWPLLAAKFLNSWKLKMGPIGCAETSVRNYYYSLRNLWVLERWSWARVSSRNVGKKLLLLAA